MHFDLTFDYFKIYYVSVCSSADMEFERSAAQEVLARPNFQIHVVLFFRIICRQCSWLSLLRRTYISLHTYVRKVLYKQGDFWESSNNCRYHNPIFLCLVVVIASGWEKVSFSLLFQFIVWNINWSLVFASSFLTIRVNKFKCIPDFVTMRRSWQSICGPWWRQRFTDCTTFLQFF